MLKIIVKTLDSQTREFEVPDSTTIGDFKKKIASSVNIPPNQQRLIFQGRVLQDDYVLSPALNGMALHLVTRPANVSAPVTSSTTSTSNVNTPSRNEDPFNSGQLGQMIFQQAMSGLGAFLSGGSQNVPMSMNTNSGNRNFMEPPINVHVSVNPIPATVGATATSSQALNSNLNRPNVRFPNQELRYVERLLNEVNNALDQLEQSHSSSSRHPGSSGASEAEPSRVPGNQASDGAKTEADSKAAASGTPRRSNPFPSCPNHPPLNEFASCNSRLLKAQHRLEPFMLRYIDFLYKDPSFQSTQSVEFSSTAQFLRLTLHCQSLVSEIQGLLSNIVIPLDRTPPRVAFIRSTSEHRSSSDLPPRRFPHSYDAPHPNRPHVHFHAPTPPTQQIPPNQEIQLRVRVPPTGNSQTTSTDVPPEIGVSAPHVRRSSPSAPVNQTTPVSGPPYSIVIDTVIQPRIEISVGTEAANNDVTSTVTSQPGPTPRVFTNQQPHPPNSALSNSSPIPVIPGIPPELFQNIFQTVAGSFLRATNEGGPQQSARVIINGPPGGPNQVPSDVSSIISQAVASSVSAHSAADRNRPPSTAASTPRPPTRSGAPGTTVPPTATPENNASSESGTIPPSGADGPTLQGGRFGTRIPPNRTPPPSNPNLLQQFQQIQGSSPILQIFLNRPIGDFFASFGLDAEPGDDGVLSRITHLVAAQLSMADIVGAGQGRQITQPKLTRLRNDIRRLVLSECFNGVAPSQQRIVEYSRSTSEENREMLVDFFADVMARPGVDLVQSNILLLSEFIATALNILFFEDDARFFNSMYTHIRHSLSVLVAVNEYAVQGGRRELSNLLERLVAESQFGGALNTLVQMSHSQQDPRDRPYEAYIQSLASLHPAGNQENLDRFIVRRPEPKSSNIAESSRDPSPDSSRGRSRESSRDRSHDSPHDQSNSSELSRPENKESNAEKPKKEAENTHLAPPSGSSSASAVATADNPAEVNGNSWENDVPSDWVPIITDDINLQIEADPQPPLSDAYKAGNSRRNPQSKQ